MPVTKQRLRSRTEIHQAYRLLFGRSFPEGLHVQELKPNAIKRAFRRRALETHPDRLVGSKNRTSSQFVQVSEAYHILLDAVEFGLMDTRQKRVSNRQAPEYQAARRETPQHKSRHKNSQRVREQRFGAQQYYAGPMPSRPLRLGEFLYYSGHISWQELVASLTWQRQQRMRFGEIAQRWGMLNAAAIGRISRSQHSGERFGECALRIGEMTAFQRMAVVGKQHLQRPLLGAFFIREALLSEEDLALVQRESDLHNANFKIARAA